MSSLPTKVPSGINSTQSSSAHGTAKMLRSIAESKTVGKSDSGEWSRYTPEGGGTFKERLQLGALRKLVAKSNNPANSSLGKSSITDELRNVKNGIWSCLSFPKDLEGLAHADVEFCWCGSEKLDVSSPSCTIVEVRDAVPDEPGYAYVPSGNPQAWAHTLTKMPAYIGKMSTRAILHSEGSGFLYSASDELKQVKNEYTAYSLKERLQLVKAVAERLKEYHKRELAHGDLSLDAVFATRGSGEFSVVLGNTTLASCAGTLQQDGPHGKDVEDLGKLMMTMLELEISDIPDTYRNASSPQSCLPVAVLGFLKNAQKKQISVEKLVVWLEDMIGNIVGYNLNMLRQRIGNLLQNTKKANTNTMKGTQRKPTTVTRSRYSTTTSAIN